MCLPQYLDGIRFVTGITKSREKEGKNKKALGGQTQPSQTVQETSRSADRWLR